MAEFKNCKICGRVFTSVINEDLCRNCREMEEKEFNRVKEYLYENPGATLTEIVTALGVSVKKIKKYLREGRLEILGEGGNIILECERCGKAIKTGRFCNECQRELSIDLRETAGQLKNEINVRNAEKEKGMRFRYLDTTRNN